MADRALVVGAVPSGVERVSGCLRLRGFEVSKCDGSVECDRVEAIAGGVSVAVFLSDVGRRDVERVCDLLRIGNPSVKIIVEGQYLGGNGLADLVASGLIDFCGGIPLDLDGLNVVVGRSLLLVDDNMAFVMPMAQLLRGKGFDVVDVLSLEDGISAVERYGKFLDVGLLDYDLDGEFSIDLVRQLRCVNPGCFIVMMTGGHYADMGFDDLIKEGVINMFVKKPFMARDLLEVLNKVAGIQ